MGALSPDDAAAHVVVCPTDLMVMLGGKAWQLIPRHQADEDPAAAIAAVAFDRIVVGRLLGTTADLAAHDGILEYHRDPGSAVARASSGAAFLLPPVSLSAVWRAAAAGLRLPPKSTYFEPKIPSGLLFRLLGSLNCLSVDPGIRRSFPPRA